MGGWVSSSSSPGDAQGMSMHPSHLTSHLARGWLVSQMGIPNAFFVSEDCLGLLGGGGLDGGLK